MPHSVPTVRRFFLVDAALVAAGEAGIKRTDLPAVTGLSLGQVDRALRDERDTLDLRDGALPLIFQRQADGSFIRAFTADENRAFAHLVNRYNDCGTRLEHLAIAARVMNKRMPNAMPATLLGEIEQTMSAMAGLGSSVETQAEALANA
jgi:hypothetical protein